MENILRGWHEQDPVNDTERKKNDVIFTQFQHNRNPFIDHPEWVEQISDF
jgi:endonuclease I